MLNNAWSGSNNAHHKERLVKLMPYVVLGFGAGLRGEEVPQLSLKGLCCFWDETRSQADPYIMATLYGKFKHPMPSLSGSPDAQKAQHAGTIGRVVAPAEKGPQGQGV